MERGDPLAIERHSLSNLNVGEVGKLLVIGDRSEERELLLRSCLQVAVR